MASQFMFRLSTVFAGGVMALFATAALAQDCANGRCGGAWVPAEPGYAFVSPGHGPPAPQFAQASPCAGGCYQPPADPQPAAYQQPYYSYPVQPCGAPVGYACGAVYQPAEVSAAGDWGGGVGVTEFSGGGGGGGGSGAPLAGYGDISGFVGSHSGANSSANGSANVNVTVNSAASAYATSTSTANAFGGGVGGGGHHHHGGGGQPQGGCGCLGGGSGGGMSGWGAGAMGGSGSGRSARASGGHRH